jgi:hypothetical protein
MSKNKIWFAELPSICGYGISAIGRTEEEAVKAVKKSYYEWRKGYGWFRDDFDTWEKACDYFCLHSKEVEFGKVYFEGLGE